MVSSTYPAGALLGNRFRVEGVLGAGGMATVYAARASNGAALAIKVMHRHLVQGGAVLAERFQREALASARVRGPRVVAVHDVGTLPTGEVFIVMERLAGEDLGARLKRVGRLPWVDAVRVVLQACEGVSAAHAVGVIHRDIKPSNLFLASSPHGSLDVRVVDFGIARVHGASDDRPLTMTQGESVLGSPHYMAPEQMADARRVDARADVWSLGATLYRAATGEVPFPGTTLPEICGAVLSTAPARASAVDRGVPEGLSDVIERTLQRDPNQRFGSVVELAAALYPFSLERPYIALAQPTSAPAVALASPAARPPAATPKALFVALGALFCLLVGGAVLFMATRGEDEPRKKASASAAKAPAVRREGDEQRTAGASISAAPTPPPPPPAAAPVKATAPTAPNVDWKTRTIPDMAASDGTTRIETSGFRVTKTNEEHLDSFDRFTYTVEGFDCIGSALFFRFKTVSDAKELQDGMAATPGYRMLRTDNRYVQVVLFNMNAGAVPSAACTDTVTDALTRPL